MARYIDTTKLMNNMVIYVSPKLAQSIIKAVDETPTEDVAPIVQGKWINRGDMNDGECSVCKKLIRATDSANFKYCPNCGAKMKESEEE